MKKTLIIAALIVGLILFAGESIHFLGRTYVGDKAPSFVLPKVDSTVVLDNLKGEYTLINFWNSTDAVSRREANRYRARKRRYPQSPLVVIGVNFDESEALFHEIVRLDSLEPAKQFHAAGDTARAIIKIYGLGRGYGAVLVNPDGKVSAYNPSDKQLDAIFAKR